MANTPSANLQEIVEWRGVSDLVAAEVLTDTNDSFTTGPVFAIAGVAEISKTTSSSNEAHYYDNIPAVVISGQGADEITVNVSALPADVAAFISGQYYDETTGMFVEGDSIPPYLAIGYRTQKTNGEEVYVWRYKGKFTVPAQTNTTRDDGTEANGQELTYMGISTTHKFAQTGKTAKAVNLPVSDLVDTSTFFNQVTTPDMISASTAYTLTITVPEGATASVTKNGVQLATGATVYAGDILIVNFTGGTCRVNGHTISNGDPIKVTENTVVQITTT